jgi:serine phosphatase RsbU (regulator of sigma subunit)
VRSIPLGILPVWKRAVGHLTLNAGEIFLLTSDGITEATVNQQPIIPAVSNTAKSSIQTNSMLTQEGLWQLLLQQPLPFDLNNLLAQLRQSTNNVQEDDQTILSLEVM